MSQSEKISRTSSRQPSYGGTISDIENSNSDKDYRRIAKKLAKDKSTLKDKLRRLLDDVESKTKDHQIELEKTQDYFQDQITDLTEDRDKLANEIDRLRELSVEEKEKARDDFEKKLLKQKETLEKRHGTKDSSTTIKRLETTIATLQDRLNKQLEENEMTKDTAEEYYSQKEEEGRKRITELEEQLQKLRELYTKEHRELLAITKTHRDDMEQLTLRFNRDKQQEIENITAEKNTANINLQTLRETTEKKIRAIEQQRDEQLSQSRFDLEKTKLDTERKITELSSEFRRTLDEVKRDYEGKLFEKDRQYKIEIENARKESERVLQTSIDESKRRLDGIVETSRKEIEDLRKTNQKLQTDLDFATQRLVQDTTRREEEMRKKYDQILEKTTNEMTGRCENKEKELAEHKLRTEKIIGEMEDTNDLLKNQLQQVQLNLKKVQDNSQHMNNQFVISLNKQKETAEEEISRRETAINALERQLKKTAEESLDRINSLDRKLKNSVDESKELTEKLTATKGLLDQKVAVHEATKIELQKLKEIGDKLIEKVKQLENEKETQMKKFQLEKEAFDKKLAVMEASSKNRDQEFAKYKDDSIRLTQTEVKYKEETFKLSEQYSKTKAELDSKTVLLEEFQNKFSALQATTHQLLMKNKDLDVEVERKDKDMRIAKNELEIANRNASNSFTEMTKFRNNMVEETKLKMADKDKQIADLHRKISQIEQSLKLSDQNRDQMTHKLNATLTERDNTKQLLDTFSGPNSEYKLKSKEVEKLKEDIENNKKNFSATLANLVAEKKTSDEAHKSDINKLQAKLNASELQITQTEQRIERMKLEFLRELNETKRLPPEDQDKMVKALKERDELSAQLTLETKRLDALQLEYANKSAEIKVKSKFLEDREADLRRLEETLKNTPPKLLDPQLRKARDDALATVRARTLEVGQMKEEMIQITQKLQVAEGIVKESEREKQIILRAQNEMKETYVNSLNQQQIKHEQNLKEKIDRIRDLETMLTEKLKS